MTESAPAAPPQGEVLLQVDDLEMHFPLYKGALLRRTVGAVRAVDGLSFKVLAGETLGLVGESGCGKSTTGRAILQLYRPTKGRVAFQGTDLTKLAEKDLFAYRRQMQMIFQDPYASLNPRMTVGDIIAEPLRTHHIYPTAGEVRERVQQLMARCGLNPQYVRRYPHEFSGGQRQRIGIARSLATQPRFIVCDEPISALDVSIQAQIMNLLQDLQDELGLTYLFIAHDLAAVRHISDRIAVMYLGKIVELAAFDALYDRPLHPYTQALISAVPIPDPDVESKRQRVVLEGDVPSPLSPPTGCRFHTRCPARRLNPQIAARCAAEEPALQDRGDGHLVACHLGDAASAP
jgi:oligopeptide transport system ATP-binding protein